MTQRAPSTPQDPTQNPSIGATFQPERNTHWVDVTSAVEEMLRFENPDRAPVTGLE